MPEFDLHKMFFAEYHNDGTYGTVLDAGEAMSTNWEFSYAEGRLYAKSTLAEFLREVTGGSVSVAVKYFPSAVQQLLFGDTEKTRRISYTKNGEQRTEDITGLAYGANSVAKNVGFAGFARDRVDGEPKVTAFRLARCLFGKPGKSMTTKGGNTINFATPTSTGEFMADHTDEQNMLEYATLDSDEAAEAWCRAALPQAASQPAPQTGGA